MRSAQLISHTMKNEINRVLNFDLLKIVLSAATFQLILLKDKEEVFSSVPLLLLHPGL